MPGTLYLIPNTLGPTEAAPHALSHILPEQVQDIASRLDYFVAENAKTARVFLKLVSGPHGPRQLFQTDVTIREGIEA